MTEVRMPRLSDSMEEGTIVNWLIADGAEVSVGDELVEIETDKATTVHQSDLTGVLEIALGEGETAAVGALIASIEAQSEAVESLRKAPASNGAESVAPSPPTGAPPAPRAADGERLRVTPVARRMARQSSVPLEQVNGSGPAGRIRRRDVEAMIEARSSATAGSASVAPVASEPGEPSADRGSSPKGESVLLPLSSVEQRVSRRMSESKATVPDFAVEIEVDCEQLVAFRQRLGGISESPPSANDVVVKAAAIALRRHPRVNSSFRDGQLELHGRVNVGVAVASDRGLFVPTVFDADKCGLAAIAARVREVADAVRSGSITASDLSGGTFTISNLGMFGVSRFTAVINPPQAAILAVGAMRQKLKLDCGEVREAPVADLTLCCDHRALDGAAGAGFLLTMKQLLEEPLAMAL